jgi:hypothetical protein
MTPALTPAVTALFTAAMVAAIGVMARIHSTDGALVT